MSSSADPGVTPAQSNNALAITSEAPATTNGTTNPVEIGPAKTPRHLSQPMKRVDPPPTRPDQHVKNQSLTAEQAPRHQSKPMNRVEAPSASTQDGEGKISAAEIKRQKKAEKAARRAAVKGPPPPGPSSPSSQPPSISRRLSGGKQNLQSQKTVDMGKHHKTSEPTPPARSIPIRQGSAQGVTAAAEGRQKRKADEKRVSIFGHLYGQPRRTTVAGAGKEVHPAVLALGLQLRDYVICGSNARCVAMLLCFKCVSIVIWFQGIELT